MPLEIENCKRCSKIFKKMNRDICQNCMDVEQQHFKVVYKLLNNSGTNGGITMQELAEQIGISPVEVDEIFRHYGFGTATDYLKVPCTNCGTCIMGSHRRGQFCMHCSNEVAKAAGVEIHSMEALDEKSSAEQKLRENLARQFKESKPTTPEPDARQYGLKRFH